MSNITIRSEGIYISSDTWRYLRAISAADPDKHTKDQIADELLKEIIESKYPSVVKFTTEIRKLEDDMKKELTKV